MSARGYPGVRGLLWLSLLAGCGGGWTPSTGERPGPVGEAAVLLWAAGDRAQAVACYDPLWVVLRGPWDCLDLVPPSARLGAAEIVGRGPDPCAPRLHLSAPAEGLWLWRPAGAAPLAPGPVDLDQDGQPEQAGPGPWWRSGARRLGGCVEPPAAQSPRR